MFNITIKNKSSLVFVFISVSFISIFLFISIFHKYFLFFLNLFCLGETHVINDDKQESAFEEEVECVDAIRKHRRKSLTYTRAANSIESALDEINYDSPPLNEELKNLSSGFVPNRPFHG